MSSASPRPLNVRQTAAELGVHENTIRNWVDRGLLRAIVLPGSGFRRFPQEEVERMRREMLSAYAPADELPEERPGKATQVLGDADAW